jgi:hypothetical protein
MKSKTNKKCGNKVSSKANKGVKNGKAKKSKGKK